MLLKIHYHQVCFIYFNLLFFTDFFFDSSGKGIHNVPPGVANSAVQQQQQQQQPQVLSTPFIAMSNPAMTIPAYYPYADLQFGATAARDHTTYSPYATAPGMFNLIFLLKLILILFIFWMNIDVKYNRNSESDMMPVSSQAANATAAAATQAHNPYFPGYGLYFSYAQGPMYPPSHPAALYPVQQAQNPAAVAAAAANSPFTGKANTNTAAANYGSHSYNSAGYDSISNAAAVAAAAAAAAAGGVPTQADYMTTSNKPYQQQQQHKQMTSVGGSGVGGGGQSGGNGNDLSSTASNMYSKQQHPQMNKVWPPPNRRRYL